MATKGNQKLKAPVKAVAKAVTKVVAKVASDVVKVVKNAPIEKQPQSKQQAAVSAGMFLYTDDKWSLAYYDDKDLHSMERKLFG